MATVREYNGSTPVRLNSDGTNIIDWSITGKAGGVGVKSHNYLDTRSAVTVSNGQPAGTQYAGTISCYPDDASPAIPPGTPATKDYQQWLTTSYSVTIHRGWTDYHVDDRPETYEYCQYKVTLEPGSYKFIFEAHDHAEGDWRSDYLTRWGGMGTPVINCLTQNNVSLGRYEIIANEHQHDNFIHVEFPFTLTTTPSIGVYGLGMGWVIKPRYYIVDGDVESEYFEISQYGTIYSGYTCWEPKGFIIPYTNTSVDGEVKSHRFFIFEKLEANHSLSMSTTGVTLQTFEGYNNIYIETDVQPTFYAKYNWIPWNVYPEPRPSPICIYDVHTAQDGFDSNGAAVLIPFELISNKENKGRWDMTMKHPIDDNGKWTYIAGLNIVKVNGQLFRIDRIEIVANQNQEYISAHMNHITYDLKDFWIEDAEFSVEDGTSYITQLWTHRVQDFPNQQHMIGDYEFSVTSDLYGHMDAALKDQSYIEALFGADNSMASRYNGEVYRNNFHLSINQTMENAPTGNAFAIRYGTDMTKISFRIDFSEWITNLVAVDNFGNFYACWYDTAGGEWICHHHKTKRIHFTYTPLGDNTLEMQRLIDDANAYWNVHAVPQISIEIGVANIKNDPKYEDYLNLQNFDVGYQGKIYVEHLGINTEMKITSIKRNELTGEAITIKLGSVRGSLIRQTVMSQTIVDPNSAEGVNSANNELLQEEIFEVDTKYMSSSINAMEEYAIAEMEKRTVSELEGG